MNVEFYEHDPRAEDDGFITSERDLQSTPSLEYYGRPMDTLLSAHPSRECRYPRCEECGAYAEHFGSRYCTVPMVVSKQIWHLASEKLNEMSKRIDELETLVTDEILGVEREP